jgi:hypothetical protein
MRTLRTTTPALVASAFLFSTVSFMMAQPASAQHRRGYYYAPAPPPPALTEDGFFYRRGLTLGVGLGIGGMDSDTGALDCDNCIYTPITGALDFHIGAMINPRLALLFELWVTAKPLDEAGTSTLSQSMAMVGVQYWLSPQLWIKGGLGFSYLNLSYDDGYYVEDAAVAEGGAIMGALGYEVMSAPRFAIDLQLRLGAGTYQGLGFGDQIHALTVGGGINWY